mgnify:CR=1 FL=1
MGRAASMEDLVRRTGLTRAQLESLATAGAFHTHFMASAQDAYAAAAAGESCRARRSGRVAACARPSLAVSR